jgi:hypothetical protein
MRGSMDERLMSHLPWSSTHGEFASAAAEVTEGGAVSVFTIDDSIPVQARRGYIALIIAYARADEPVTIFEDGSAALLIKEGGVAAASAAAGRVIGQLRRLGLESTVRAGAAPLTSDVSATIRHARTLADSSNAGGIGVDAG